MGWHCHRCGLPLTAAGDDICGVCLQNQPKFTTVISPLEYAFPVDQLVQAFKSNRQLAAGRILSHLLCAHVINSGITRPDVLIPVPLHHLRLFRHGFNQSWELSTYISKPLNIPLLGTVLRRSRNTTAQAGLGRKQRRKNLRNAFHWHARQQPVSHVTLIDDVMTTGTTVSECASVLLKAGATRVDVWVTARAISKHR